MSQTITCPTCNGSGKITRTDEIMIYTPSGQPGTKYVTETVRCDFCGGSGKISK